MIGPGLFRFASLPPRAGVRCSGGRAGTAMDERRFRKRTI